ncbi:enhancer of mRNA-decapping protein 3 [Manduca sexta]|uniref:enhancer of mRNA-decapping protein 3 n=1 Tax=Manduca sexta TaxID=7130 RepID=UPI0018903DB5|nr:enhancer of mRNA-decapping protein 3 [Manduca sexta]
MAKWIGYAVSVNCGEPLGCYQGTILEADGSTITLTKAFRNGFPYPKSQVTLKAADIKDLKIIEARAEPSEQTHSTVAVTKSSKKTSRATVCENLQAIPTSSATSQPSNNVAVNSKAGNSRGTGAVPARSKPIDIMGNRTNRTNNFAGSYGNTGSTPKCRMGAGGGGVHEKARRKNEACFGDAADPALDDDFDFEGNLALFDKRALWEQMRNSHKPDLVRQADDVGKFRHDENVLGTSHVARHALRVPDELRGPIDYVTDDGVVVPSVVPRLRRQLWEGMQRVGLADSAHTLLARAAADVALRLVGGGRRLEPRNAHQQPVVVALAGAHRVGAVGLAAARLLASHGARVVYYAEAAPCEALQREAALALSGVTRAADAHALPSPDLVLLALYDPLLDDQQDRHEEVLRWAGGVRGAIIALEPPTRGWYVSGGGGEAELAVRASVAGCAPAALAPSLGRVYLADVAPPLRLFADLRLQYRPPFGAASVLALHPADD